MSARATIKLGEKAVIIGGSIAGKLAAKVLANFFHEVYVIEKDRKIESPKVRSGVPQGSQGHALLKSGEKILEGLFPGITKELMATGSVVSDFSYDLSWYHHGTWKIRHPSKVMTLQQSRPFLESHLQRRLEQEPNIQFIYEAKVKSLLVSSDHSEVNGVAYQIPNHPIETLSADLVIDAAGAASLTPKWLAEIGTNTSPKTEVKVDLFYASRKYDRLSPIEKDWKGLLVYPNPPLQTHGGGIYQIEDHNWMVTLLGYGVKNPPVNEDQFLKYAASLDHPTIYQMIKDGKPASDVSVYRFPVLRRYHYEKQKNFPNRLIVMGDAFCRIDPVFAQGMSLAALEAKELEKALHKVRKTRNLERISYQAHRRFQTVLNIPWLIATIEDYRFPQTAGKKPIGLKFMQAYIKKVMLACANDERIYEKFIKVMHLQAHPITLCSPRVLWTVLLSNKQQDPSHTDIKIRT